MATRRKSHEYEQKILNEALVVLLTAEAEFLRKCRWVPLAPIAKEAPIFWRDEKGREVGQDQAIAEMKARWVALTQREK